MKEIYQKLMRKLRGQLSLNPHQPLIITGGLALGGLGLILFMLICPIAPKNASAEELRAEVTGNATVMIESSLSVALTTNLDIEIRPGMKGGFGFGTADLRVITTNSSGYAAYIHTTSEEGALRDFDKSNTRKIVPVASSMTASDFTDSLNSWGYANTTETEPDLATYVAIPTTENEALFSSNAENSDDSYRLSIGAAVSGDFPSGEYQGAVTISVVANPIEITNLMQMTYMQDMTPEICQNTADYIDVNHYATKQLIDARDGKSYWVAKLADGKCWMVQNLALDLLSADKKDNAGNIISPKTLPLTQELSDLGNQADGSIKTRSWSPAINTGLPAAQKSACSGYDITCSWNANPRNADGTEKRYVITDPYKTTTTICSSPYATLADCAPDKVTEVPLDYTPTLSFQNSGKTIDPDSASFDPHYLTGNYYAMQTAVAESFPSLSAMATATDSICPRGWTLPLAGDRDGSLRNTPGSIDYLANLQQTADGINYSPNSAPIYAIRAGKPNYATGATGTPMAGVGGVGHYETKVAVASNGSYLGTIGEGTSFYGTGAGGSFHLMSVRCVSR